MIHSIFSAFPLYQPIVEDDNAMTLPTVSVIIPCFNHANHLVEAIESVLNQTYRYFELIIINDGSTDHTPDVVRQFTDSRILYLEQENRGATAARNTGMRASSGEYIAFLDADDLWYPAKLEAHVKVLTHQPTIGATYNARFDINHDTRSIRNLWRPPLTVTLADLVTYFPFSPSDLVLRRKWAFEVGLFDESYLFYGDDLDFFCRLALAGCQFVGIDRALNYRRRHSGRVIKNLASCVEVALRPLQTTFADPRCPATVLAVADQAYTTHSLSWANWALSQGEIALGQALLRKALQHDPTLLQGMPCRLTNAFLRFSIADESQDHASMLTTLFKHLPPEMKAVRAQLPWATARGYLDKGIRHLIWNRGAEGMACITSAAAAGAWIDEVYIKTLTKYLLNYEAVCGADACGAVLQRLSTALPLVADRADIRHLQGNFLINQAFAAYHQRNYRKAVPAVLRAISHHPAYLINRGVIAIFTRSVMGTLSKERVSPTLPAYQG